MVIIHHITRHMVKVQDGPEEVLWDSRLPLSIRTKEAIELSVIEQFMKIENQMKNFENEFEQQDIPQEEPSQNEPDIETQGDFRGFRNKSFDIKAARERLFSDISVTTTHQESQNISSSSSSTAPAISQVSLLRLTLQKEIETYNAIPKLAGGKDAFNWWKENKVLFPLLGTIEMSLIF